jgi:hypothetical protein
MRYFDLFKGRADTYALAYKRGKGYRPIKGKFTKNKLAQHLSGEISAGMYLIRPEDSSVRVMAFDVDTDDKALCKAIGQSLVRDVPDTSILIEKTGGRGWHVWVFVDDWLPARLARAFMRSALDRISLEYPVELYPKQDRIRADGLGNLIRLPGGIHHKTGETGTLYNAFGLEFELEDEPDPELPIEPAPLLAISMVAEKQLNKEQAKMPDFTGSGPGTLPCIDNFQNGVGEGYRDEAMFRLSAYLHRQQIPVEAAWITLEKANENNKPPLSSSELSTKLNSAYSGGGYGLPCSSDLVGLDSAFCNPTCPVYATSKERSGGTGFVGTSDARLAGKFPRMVERNGAYLFQTKVKSGIQERVISNFVIEVLSRLEMPDINADVLRVRMIAQAGREDIKDIPVTAFASKNMFLRELTRAEYAWYGTDLHCQFLKAHLTSGDMETQTAITKLGRASTPESEIWITPNSIITPNGLAPPDFPYTYHRPDHFGIVSIKKPEKSFSLARTKEVLRDLWNLNSLSVMVPILGWALSVPFKPWFMQQLGHFPLLMLYGTRGAGKTQLIQRVILPLFGYSSREPQIHFCDTTRFVLVSYGASTTTVPLFLDEYRPNALPGTKLRQLWDHWRHLYAEDTDHRGQADLSRLSFKQTSPVIVAGEEMVSDPAMQERMVQVALTPDSLTQSRQKAFKSLPPMEMASTEFITACLKMDPVPLMDKAKEVIAGKWERQASPRLYDNLLIISFGLQVWSKITGRTVTKRMIPFIFDVSSMVQTEEDIRTSLWADDFLLDIAGIIEEKGPFTWGLVEKDGDQSYMYFNLRRAHAEWAKDMKSRGDHAMGLQPIKRQLMEKAASEFMLESGLQKRIMGANTRVYKVDLTRLRDMMEE